MIQELIFDRVIDVKRADRLWFKLISEVLVNLSAGWIGIALTVPLTSDKETLAKFGLLTGNLALAILSLIAAFRMRKKGGNR